MQGHHANLHIKPIIFDPVGVGATTFRRTVANGPLYYLSPYFVLTRCETYIRVAEHVASKRNKGKCRGAGSPGQFRRGEFEFKTPFSGCSYASTLGYR